MPDIKDIFASWGKSCRQIPEKNETLKSEVLEHFNRLPPLRGETSKSRFPWISLAFAGLALIMLVLRPISYKMPSQSDSIGVAEPIQNTQNMIDVRAIPPVYEKNPLKGGGAITDDREFLKTNYSAEILTRNPSEMIKRVRTIIHAFDGRIDSLHSSKEYGTVNFAIPATKFDAFQAEINALARKRFINITIDAQNILPQKQQIERRIEEVEKILEDLRAKQFSRDRDEQIKYYETELERLSKESQSVVDNVATIQGTISLRGISVLETAKLYAGPYFFPIILALVAIVAFILNRRKKYLI